jgi:hypothetical protein
MSVQLQVWRLTSCAVAAAQNLIKAARIPDCGYFIGFSGWLPGKMVPWCGSTVDIRHPNGYRQISSTVLYLRLWNC